MKVFFCHVTSHKHETNKTTGDYRTVPRGRRGGVGWLVGYMILSYTIDGRHKLAAAVALYSTRGWIVRRRNDTFISGQLGRLWDANNAIYYSTNAEKQVLSVHEN